MNDYDSAEAAKALVLQDIAALITTLDGTQVEPEVLWFRNMLSGILKCGLEDYESVSVQSPYRAAWGRRNLLELKVITDYILDSGENAESFQGELLIDAKEFFEAIG